MENVTEYNDSHSNFIFTPKQVGAVMGILEGHAFINDLLGLDLLDIEGGE